MSYKVIASFVSFNPNISKLKKAIDSVYSQVDQIIIVDNGSENILEILNAFGEYQNVSIIKNFQNIGIAAALNQAVDFSAKKCDWLLTMDQDSEAPIDIIEQYERVIQKEEKIGILTLQIKKNIDSIVEKKNTLTEVQRCITSGSLMNLSAMEDIGEFDESMFIDWVDHDICKRMKLAGYRIIRVDSLILKHELGPQIPIPITQKLNNILGTKVLKRPHSPLRTYYYIRNGIYYIRKFKKSMTKEEVKFAKYEIAMSIRRGLLLGKNKFEYISSICRGIYDGNKMKVCKG